MMTLSHYTCGPNILPLYEMSRIKTYHIQIIQHYKFWKRLIEEVLKTLYKFYVLNINFSLGKYSKRKYEGSDIGPTPVDPSPFPMSYSEVIKMTVSLPEGPKKDWLMIVYL